MAIYIDTSALVKRYVSERGSDAFDAFVQTCEEDCVISPLVVTELESVLQRLRRESLIDAKFLRRARETFHADVVAALWAVRPFEPSSFERATELIRTLDAPLATLDALHLASALDMHCTAMASGDRRLCLAAERRGLSVHHFVV